LTPGKRSKHADIAALDDGVVSNASVKGDHTSFLKCDLLVTMDESGLLAVFERNKSNHHIIDQGMADATFFHPVAIGMAGSGAAKGGQVEHRMESFVERHLRATLLTCLSEKIMELHSKIGWNFNRLAGPSLKASSRGILLKTKDFFIREDVLDDPDTVGIGNAQTSKKKKGNAVLKHPCDMQCESRVCLFSQVHDRERNNK
jgi:hypothetical protein